MAPLMLQELLRAQNLEQGSRSTCMQMGHSASNYPGKQNDTICVATHDAFSMTCKPKSN